MKAKLPCRGRYRPSLALPSSRPRAPPQGYRGRRSERFRQAERCFYRRNLCSATQGEWHHMDSHRPLGAESHPSRGRCIRCEQDQGSHPANSAVLLQQCVTRKWVILTALRLPAKQHRQLLAASWQQSDFLSVKLALGDQCDKPKRSDH